MRHVYSSAFSVLLIATFYCTPADAQGVASHQHNHAHGAVKHEHPTVGPHGGALLELGNEEYHAEVVLEEKRGHVSIVLLDSRVKELVSIDAHYLLVNVKSQRGPKQYRLVPLYPQGTTSGPASTFGIVSKELMNFLHDHDTTAKLAVRIGKKSYSAVIRHEHHEHTAHAHAESSQPPR